MTSAIFISFDPFFWVPSDHLPPGGGGGRLGLRYHGPTLWVLKKARIQGGGRLPLGPRHGPVSAPEERGIIPRATEEIFSHIQTRAHGVHMWVLSYPRSRCHPDSVSALSTQPTLPNGGATTTSARGTTTVVSKLSKKPDRCSLIQFFFLGARLFVPRSFENDAEHIFTKKNELLKFLFFSPQSLDLMGNWLAGLHSYLGRGGLSCFAQ